MVLTEIEALNMPAGVVEVREIEEDVDQEKEHVFLVSLDAPVEVVVGETAGHDVYAASEYFIVVDVDYVEDISEEQAQFMQMQGMDIEPGERHNDLSALIISNEDGQPGAVVEELDGGTAQEALDVLASL